ncbi:MAG TPA: hypothetical protein VNE21_03450, partial [Mycobacteriales bacterium]|nr:hypothetical protein [Mycobacteriales bacterium]
PQATALLAAAVRPATGATPAGTIPVLSPRPDALGQLPSVGGISGVLVTIAVVAIGAAAAGHVGVLQQRLRARVTTD